MEYTGKCTDCGADADRWVHFRNGEVREVCPKCFEKFKYADGVTVRG